jgi:hypothetical protein
VSELAEGGRRANLVSLGIVVAPVLEEEVSAKVVADLGEDLRCRYGTVGWSIELTVDRLVVPPAPMTEIFSAARRALLDADWDLGIVVTDLPLRLNGRPVSRHTNPTHGIAIVSLPALGVIHLRERLQRTLLDMVGELVGDRDENGSRWQQGLLRELAAETAPRMGRFGFLFTPAVLLGHVRLLLGMVRTNRPWRLAARLYAALVAALAAGAYGLVTSDIWRISAALGWWRLGLACAVSILATTVAVIAVHRLWERAPDQRVRDQVILFNVATTVTVAIGIVTLYLALFALILAGGALVITPHLLARSLEHGVGARDYAALAWFVASLATVGGALGAGLESNEAVREAAYASAPSGEPPSDQASSPR